MKHGKKPTVTQKKLLQSAGMVWKEWLAVVDLPDVLIVKHRISGVTRVLDKVEHPEHGR